MGQKKDVNAKRPASAPIEAVRHKDKRRNIPTRELRGFVEGEESRPPTVLYPRDPSLDPQLVWKGKDEQDQQPLAVPAVPVYIQEKISPQALVEELRQRQQESDPQPSLFADFNGIEFEQLVEFYRHSQNWTNRLILGDSLLVMNSLAEKERLKGQVQMIYLDPPYGIKFGSNWQVSTRKRDVKDGKVEDATRQPEQIKAFRDTWQLGIHSYLAYLRDRLIVARELLTESGSVFVQIGDENFHLVRSVLDEVFGSDNFCSVITYAKTTTTTGRLLPGTTDFLLWYAKDADRVKYTQIYSQKTAGGAGASNYNQVELSDGSRRSMTEAEKQDPEVRPAGSRLFRFDNLTSPRVREARTGYYEVAFDGRTFLPQKGEWKTHSEGMNRLKLARRLASTGPGLYYVRFIEDFPAYPLNNDWGDTVVAGFASAKKYVVETSTKVIQRCLLMTTDPGDLVLDPTCGSGTTAYVAEQWGRRWITIDTSRVALALARTRLMTAKFPYYLLADSAAGRKKEAELNPSPALGAGDESYEHDIRKGFVYRRVPHVTLKSIANNPDIKESMSRAEIDAAIARHAETETLYDQPYEDPKTVRVSGPFTVESLSPHRILSPDDEELPADTGSRATDDGQFVPMILDNLKKAGVQNTVKKERLTFDRLDPFAGLYLHAEGEYTEKGKSKRVAVCIGPEHGTVGPELVRDAAKEAVKGRGFDLLVVCGFAFDPHVSEETKQYGKLTVLTARMNPDLAMGDELLKKTGAGNLFMIFGEPDIDIQKQKDGKLVVEIRGVDVYDPTTGQIRSHSTDDIACWFLDTAYNEESFFVRHAYFCGADEPYEKLKRALRTEIDESAWASLYATRSRPFDRPKKGKIAVKVINHYGDEVLKVYGV